MNNQYINTKAEMELDFMNLMRIIWGKLWIVVLSMIVCGAIAFTSAVFLIQPKYTSTAMMYVNNSSLSVGGSTTISFSSSQLSAARSLLDVYVIILRSRTTLEAAMEKSGLDEVYTYSEMRSMVSAGSVGGTEIFSISATCEDKETAELIVDTIVEILPERISEIVDGSSVRLVDAAILPKSPSSPSYTSYAMIGILAGAIVSAAAIVIDDLLNTSVRDEEYLKSRYNIPVLAVVPELYDASNKRDSRKYNYKYGYKNRFRYRQKYWYNSGYQYHTYGSYVDATRENAEESANNGHGGDSQ